MKITLTPKLEQWVEALVESGRYSSASEVVGVALHKLKQDEETDTYMLEELRAAVQEGLDSFERDGAVPFNDAFVENIKQLSRDRKR